VVSAVAFYQLDGIKIFVLGVFTIDMEASDIKVDRVCFKS
jgi:hypothetical protein